MSTVKNFTKHLVRTHALPAKLVEQFQLWLTDLCWISFKHVYLNTYSWYGEKQYLAMFDIHGLLHKYRGPSVISWHLWESKTHFHCVYLPMKDSLDHHSPLSPIHPYNGRPDPPYSTTWSPLKQRWWPA